MKYLIIISLLLSSSLFAMPCPNGRGIMYKGDSLEEVLKQCGPPTSKKTTKQTLLLQEQWIYNLAHAYDPGSTQLVVTFNNSYVSGILINERYSGPLIFCRQFAVQPGLFTTVQTSCGNTSYNTPSTNVCGPAFGIGATQAYVASACGTPANKTVLQDNFTESTELFYGGSSRQTIIFQNGKLIDWR